MRSSARPGQGGETQDHFGYEDAAALRSTAEVRDERTGSSDCFGLHGVNVRVLVRGQSAGKALNRCHWFVSLEEARHMIEAWRLDYNTERPHRALGQETPAAWMTARERLLEAAG
jgi:transposase InsO family protein